MEATTTINKFDLDILMDVVRLTHRINNCQTKETAFDRRVCLAMEVYDKIQEQNKDEKKVL